MSGKSSYNKYGEDVPVLVEEWITAKKLKHGDIVNFDEPDSRDEESYIICQDELEKRLVWIKNPNELMSDYLTINQRITRLLGNAISFYSKVIEDRQTLNIHLGSHDATIKKTFGRVNADWQFDYFYEDGVLTQVSLRIPGKDSDYDLGDVAALSAESLRRFSCSTPANGSAA
eukprot:Lankesteria_metandrocarpae@DN9316_c0_g1_i2.p1